MASIRQRYHAEQPLPADMQELVEHYYATVAPIAVRAYTYLVLICTRESRHLKNGSTVYAKAKQEHPGRWPQAVFDHHAQGYGEDGIQQQLMNHPPKGVTLGQWTSFLAYQFRKGAYSGGYGGEKWAIVTDCVDSFVHGKTTAEIMLDTVWTLVHNGGPIAPS